MCGAHVKLLIGPEWPFSSYSDCAGTYSGINGPCPRDRGQPWLGRASTGLAHALSRALSHALIHAPYPAPYLTIPRPHPRRESKLTRTSRTVNRELSIAKVASRLGSSLFQATRTSGLLSGDSYRIVECSRLLQVAHQPNHPSTTGSAKGTEGQAREWLGQGETDGPQVKAAERAVGTDGRKDVHALAERNVKDLAVVRNQLRLGLLGLRSPCAHPRPCGRSGCATGRHLAVGSCDTKGESTHLDVPDGARRVNARRAQDGRVRLVPVHGRDRCRVVWSCRVRRPLCAVAAGRRRPPPSARGGMQGTCRGERAHAPGW